MTTNAIMISLLILIFFSLINCSDSMCSRVSRFLSFIFHSTINDSNYYLCTSHQGQFYILHISVRCCTWEGVSCSLVQILAVFLLLCTSRLWYQTMYRWLLVYMFLKFPRGIVVPWSFVHYRNRL